MSVKGTQTEKNILTAFCGESQARNKYTYFASKAQKEGYRQIQAIFQETADHEKEHAKRLFEHINELKKGDKSLDEIKVEAVAPTILGSTADNLKAAIAGENYEHHGDQEQHDHVAALVAG